MGAKKTRKKKNDDNTEYAGPRFHGIRGFYVPEDTPGRAIPIRKRAGKKKAAKKKKKR